MVPTNECDSGKPFVSTEKTRREPKELDIPAARGKCDLQVSKVEFDAHLDLPLKG